MTLSRPTNIADMKERMDRFSTDAGQDKGLSIEIFPTDIFVNTYPKAGTTWAQQIVHQLRSGGSMDFAEICEVVPWLELAYDMGIDPEDQGDWEPRAFKTHLNWTRVPKGARYIYIVRDPVSSLRSFYSFFEGWAFEPGTVTIEEFASDWFMEGTGSGNYWNFIVEWWPQLERDDVLPMAYEHMVADPAAVVRRIASFMGIEDADAIDVAITNSSRDFMAANADRFDEHVLRAVRDPVMGLPPGGASHKARAAGPSLVVPESVRAALDELWHDEVEAAIDFASYADMIDAMARL